MNQKVSQICYLCFSPATTRDHIPPKGIFPAPLPSNLITVPCCEPCNNGFSKRDEFLRSIAALAVNMEETGKDSLTKLFARTLPQGRIKDMLAEIRLHEEKITQTPVGLGVQASFPAKFVRPLIVRITKGLLSTLYPDVDYHKFEWEVTPLNQFKSARAGQVIEQMGTGSAFIERGGGAFRAWHTVFENGGQGGWFYSFHGALGFVVMHRFRTGQIRKNSGIPFQGAPVDSGKILEARKI